MRKILVAVAGFVALLGLWRLGLLWLGPSAGSGGDDSPDRDWQPLTQSSTKEEFESKFKQIHLDMSEKQVDQILAGYPCERRELAENEKENHPNPYGFEWKLKRKGSFLKTYDCRTGTNEGDFYIQVILDHNYSVISGFLGNEFQSKCSKIQLDMTEEQVDQILAGYPCKERRDVFDFEKERALWPGGKHTRTASFVKTYDCKPRPNDGDFYIAVYFDENYFVVGKVFGEYIS
jgi:hypothetical protein